LLHLQFFCPIFIHAFIESPIQVKNTGADFKRHDYLVAFLKNKNIKHTFGD